MTKKITESEETMPAARVTIEGSAIHAVSPEGKEASMPLDEFFKRVRGARMDTGDMILPDGVKTIISDGVFSIWAHETPPQIFNFKWIADGSPAEFGEGTEYRTVKIALPYLIVLAVFCPDKLGRVTLSNFNECFFSTGPLKSLDDELCYPALLNCSKFEPQEGNPLAWICTQYLNRSFDREPDTNKRLRGGFKSLMNCLLATGFNYSSDRHEASSWFTESRSVDERIATVDAWQEASKANDLFGLQVSWLKTGLSLRQITERIFKNHHAGAPAPDNAAAVARIVFNHQRRPQKDQVLPSPLLNL